MSSFAKTLAERVEGYIALRRSLGYSFNKRPRYCGRWSATLRPKQLDGPLTQETALNFVLVMGRNANGRAIRHGVVRRFADYLAIYDPPNRSARSRSAAQIPRYPAATHLERRGTRLAHVGMPPRFARIIRERSRC